MNGNRGSVLAVTATGILVLFSSVTAACSGPARSGRPTVRIKIVNAEPSPEALRPDWYDPGRIDELVVRCLSGSCSRGACRLEVLRPLPAGVTMNRRGLDHGTYEGACQDGMPHGKGSLRTADNWTYSGTYVRGRLHGPVTGRHAVGVYYATLVGSFVDGRRSGEWTFRGADGHLLRRELHPTSGEATVDWFDDRGRPLPRPNAGYTKSLCERVRGAALSNYNFHGMLEVDRMYLRTEAARKRAATEVVELNACLDGLRAVVRREAETGAQYFEPEVSGPIWLLEHLWYNRRILDHPAVRFSRLGEHCLNPGELRVVGPTERPSVATLVRVLRTSTVDRRLLRRMLYHLRPFHCSSAHAYARGPVLEETRLGAQAVLILMWKSPGVIMHETGHAAGSLLGFPNEAWWAMRRVPPVVASSPFSDPVETFAEDFRVLFGGPHASYKHTGGFRPLFGDVRDYPDREAATRRMIQEALATFKNH